MAIEDIKRIAVVGAGIMGSGIAQEFAVAGYQVRINDVSAEKLDQALSAVRGNLDMLVSLGLVTKEQAEPAAGRITAAVDLAEAAAGADLVVEAVSENLELKQSIFRRLDEACPPHSILASNSSTLVPSGMAAVTKRPEKVLGTHYFNPPHLFRIVEVIRGPQTADETVTTVYDLLTKVGKRPVVVHKEAPGFVINRLQWSLGREALNMVANGMVSPEDLDVILSNTLGPRWAAAGLFELMDLQGLDIWQAAAPYIFPTFDSARDVPEFVKEKVARGELGFKTGKGFYDCSPEAAQALRQRIAETMLLLSKRQAGSS